jgi:hypothetical protein
MALIAGKIDFLACLSVSVWVGLFGSGIVVAALVAADWASLCVGTGQRE